MNLREIIKSSVRGLATIAVLPLLFMHFLKIPLLGKNRALEGTSQLMALLPGLIGQYLRRATLAWILEECHPTASIGFGTIFSRVQCKIGPNVYIGPYCSLGNVVVERDVLIATAVQIPSGGKMHGIADLTRPIREQPGEFTTVTIGRGVWIGSGAIIMADVGEETVIAAGAIVTKPIPTWVIAGGIPAKVIKTRAEAALEQEVETA
ncbi:MAG: acyltransferase [Zavarzinella sp.]